MGGVFIYGGGRKLIWVTGTPPRLTQPANSTGGSHCLFWGGGPLAISVKSCIHVFWGTQVKQEITMMPYGVAIFWQIKCSKIGVMLDEKSKFIHSDLYFLYWFIYKHPFKNIFIWFWDHIFFLLHFKTHWLLQSKHLIFYLHVHYLPLHLRQVSAERLTKDDCQPTGRQRRALAKKALQAASSLASLGTLPICNGIFFAAHIDYDSIIWARYEFVFMRKAISFKVAKSSVKWSEHCSFLNKQIHFPSTEALGCPVFIQWIPLFCWELPISLFCFAFRVEIMCFLFVCYN